MDLGTFSDFALLLARLTCANVLSQETANDDTEEKSSGTNDRATVDKNQGIPRSNLPWAAQYSPFNRTWWYKCLVGQGKAEGVWKHINANRTCEEECDRNSECLAFDATPAPKPSCRMYDDLGLGIMRAGSSAAQLYCVKEGLPKRKAVSHVPLRGRHAGCNIDCSRVNRVFKLLTDNPMLAHTVRYCCSNKGARLLMYDSYDPTTWLKEGQPHHRYDPLYEVHDVTFPKVGTSSKDLFRPLWDKNSPAHEITDRAVIVRVDCNLCALLEGDRSKVKKRFILFGPFHESSHSVVGGHGVLSTGPYHNGIPSLWEKGTLTGHTTYNGIKLMGLWFYLRMNECGPNSYKQLFDLLEDKFLAAWIVAQGSFLMQEPGSDEWKPHQKILNFPLGNMDIPEVTMERSFLLAAVNKYVERKGQQREKLVAWTASRSKVRKPIAAQAKQLYHISIPERPQKHSYIPTLLDTKYVEHNPTRST